MQVNFRHMPKKSRLFSAVILLLLIPDPLSAQSNPNEKRIALIIGNSDYLMSPLVNPVNDANAIADVLKAAGFKIIQHENMAQASMRRAIADFGRELASHDVGLFYYAGHGVQMNGRNYLIPIDAKIQYESDIEVESIDLAAVFSKMEGAGNRLNLVILDACRDNPFASNSRPLNQGLAFTSAPSGTLIAYATAPGKVAEEGEGKNGVYTKFLVKHIGTPGLRIEDIFKQVRVDVKKATSDQQVPWESSSLEGDFYFLPGNAPISSSIAEPNQSDLKALRIAEKHKRPDKPVAEESPASNSLSLNCADLREKETFAGEMGFSALTKMEKAYLLSDCP
ncbi:MAG: caspase domain-containing protein [Methylococcales bacterium]